MQRLGEGGRTQGVLLSPCLALTFAPSVFETQPDLWAEAGSLQEPWANLTLVCRAPLVTTDFQLFKDGALQEQMHLDEGATEQRFPLGAVTGGTRGLYRCRYAMDGGNGWTSLSNLLEVTGAGEWGPPSLPLLVGTSPQCVGKTLTLLSLGFPVCKMRVVFVLTPEGL